MTMTALGIFYLFMQPSALGPGRAPHNPLRQIKQRGPRFKGGLPSLRPQVLDLPGPQGPSASVPEPRVPSPHLWIHHDSRWRSARLYSRSTFCRWVRKAGGALNAIAPGSPSAAAAGAAGNPEAGGCEAEPER